MATDGRGTTSMSTTTESGLEPNIAGAVAYLFGFVVYGGFLGAGYGAIVEY